MDRLTALLVLALAASYAAIAMLLVRVRRLEYRIQGLSGLLEKAVSFDRVLRKLERAMRRPRRRYIVFRVVSEKPVDPGSVEQAIEEKFREVLGEAGYTLARPKLVQGGGDCWILRVRHTYKNHAIAVLGLVREVGGTRVLLVPVATSGTIRRARSKCS